MGKLNLNDLLDQLDKASGDGNGRNNNSKAQNDMTEQEQADQLMEVLLSHSNPPQIKAGDFVRYRKEYRHAVRNGDRLHVVVETLKEPVSVPLEPDIIFSHVATFRLDTILAVTNAKDKGAVEKYYADSRNLEAYPGGERLKPQHS